MKISEAAKLTGLNVSSIRFYERKGLLMPQREDGSKYRDYTDEDVQRIRADSSVSEDGDFSGNH